MKIKTGSLLSIFFLVFSSNTLATPYTTPPADQSLIGKIQYRAAESNDTVVTVAKRYDIGHNAIKNANPFVDMSGAFSGAPLQIPTQHLLPDQPREGIVINLPEMRMYYFLPDTNQVLTYPIGIGKMGKTIPITKAEITKKAKDPAWIPPEDIRQWDLAEQGIVLPKIMPPGPDNPLGRYAIYMSVPTYLIHSTIFPESIGRRASFGCIRMYEFDIKEFFPSIQGGIPVVIINSPVKLGWEKDRLYVEAHHTLEEHSDAYDATLPGMIHNIAMAAKNKPTLIDWQILSYIDKERDGIPHEIGVQIAAK